MKFTKKIVIFAGWLMGFQSVSMGKPMNSSELAYKFVLPECARETAKKKGLKLNSEEQLNLFLKSTEENEATFKKYFSDPNYMSCHERKLLSLPEAYVFANAAYNVQIAQRKNNKNTEKYIIAGKKEALVEEMKIADEYRKEYTLLPDGYTFKKTYQQCDDGFNAYKAVNSDNSKCVFGIAGTESPRDINVDAGIGVGQITGEAQQELFEDIISCVRDKKVENILITGHSLGGGLAGYFGAIATLAIAERYYTNPLLDMPHTKIRVVTWNGVGDTQMMLTELVESFTNRISLRKLKDIGFIDKEFKSIFRYRWVPLFDEAVYSYYNTEDDLDSYNQSLVNYMDRINLNLGRDAVSKIGHQPGVRVRLPYDTAASIFKDKANMVMHHMMGKIKAAYYYYQDNFKDPFKIFKDLKKDAYEDMTDEEQDAQRNTMVMGFAARKAAIYLKDSSLIYDDSIMETTSLIRGRSCERVPSVLSVNEVDESQEELTGTYVLKNLLVDVLKYKDDEILREYDPANYN